MTTSIRAFMAGIVDYAGLFPPAKLPLDQAIINYSKYRTSSDAWMLGRFICPASKLTELEPYCSSLFDEEHSLTVSALATVAVESGGLMDSLQRDMQVIDEVSRNQAGRMQIDVLEMRLPSAAVYQSDEGKIATALTGVSELIRNSKRPLRPFFEIPIQDRDQATVSRAIRAIDGVNRQLETNAGFKLRCGGLEKDAFPSIEMVTHCLMECLSNDVPFKATAGLHHPLRHYDDSVATTMHGFVNVFGAGILAYAAGDLNKDDLSSLIRDILSDEDSAHFHFDNNGFRWQSHSATIQDIEACRRSATLSFGSCSFDEPRDDLRALGWL